MRIFELHIQHAIMKEYAEVFGDLTIVDGTHKMTKYNLIMMVFSNICSLGKFYNYYCLLFYFIFLGGFSFGHSENSDLCSRSAEYFNLVNENSTLITDAAPCFKLLASKRKAHHMLCLKHYSENIFKCLHGMNDSSKSEFISSISKLLYESFYNEQDLDDELIELKEEYDENSNVIKTFK